MSSRVLVANKRKDLLSSESSEHAAPPVAKTKEIAVADKEERAERGRTGRTLDDANIGTMLPFALLHSASPTGTFHSPRSLNLFLQPNTLFCHIVSFLAIFLGNSRAHQLLQLEAHIVKRKSKMHNVCRVAFTVYFGMKH